jgi:collagen type VI alpha
MLYILKCKPIKVNITKVIYVLRSNIYLIAFRVFKKLAINFTDCSQSKADVVFLLDSSGSVGETNFAFLTTFISDLISDFNIGQEFIQVGLVTYETDVTNQFDLNQFVTKEELINATNHVAYNGGWTFTDRGLNYTLTHSFAEENGARPNTTRVLVIFTDGVSSYPYSTRSMAGIVKNSDITIISVGIDSGVDSPELFAIASQEEFVFRATSFTDLETIKYSLENIICKIFSSTNSIYPSAIPPQIPLTSNSSSNSTSTELLSSTLTTEADSTPSDTSSSANPVSNLLSTSGTVSTLTGSTDGITSPVDTTSLSTESDESSSTSIPTTQKSTQQTSSAALSTTQKSTQQTSSLALSTTQKSTQQTSSLALSTTQKSTQQTSSQRLLSTTGSTAG